jgi:ATP adenylyltransferase
MTAYLTAPWREAYVRNVFKMKGCIFCQALRSQDDLKALILYRGQHNFIILNKYPYTPGHLMIAPYRHLARIEAASREATEEMMELLKMSLKLLRRRYRPHGFNLGMNLGQCAGAGVVGHYHLHLIPRWSGDANFMPLVAQTKVVIEDLETTFNRLYPLFQKEASRRKEPAKTG